MKTHTKNIVANWDAETPIESPREWRKFNMKTDPHIIPDWRARVDYAARVILDRQQTSRRFDGCFEHGDGDAVVLALVQRSQRCRALAANLPWYISPSSIKDAKAWLTANGECATITNETRL